MAPQSNCSGGFYNAPHGAEGKFRTAFVADGDEVFVYGREVQDFRSLDYEAIAAMLAAGRLESARGATAK